MASHPSPLRLVVAAGVGYLVGTAPSADVAARRATGGPLDLRTVGTGNPGAANAMGQLGRAWGVAVLVADAGKGVVAARAGRLLAGDAGALVASAAAVVGHCLPVWRGGHGGKGVATAVGVALDVCPGVLPPVLAVAAATQAVVHDTDRSVVAAAAAWVAASVPWSSVRALRPWGVAPGPGLTAWSAAVAGFVLWRFRARRRLVATEPVIDLRDPIERPAFVRGGDGTDDGCSA